MLRRVCASLLLLSMLLPFNTASTYAYQPTEPPLLPGEPAPVLRGEMPMRTYSLDFYRLQGGLEAEVIRAMAMDVEASIEVGSAEIASGLTGRVSIRFEPPQSGECAIRGLTLSNQRTIRLFYAPGSNPKNIVRILAHELFHQLQHDYYGETDHRKADNMLLEGMATWGSRSYNLNEAGVPIYHADVKRVQAEGELLPLTTNLVADCRTTTRVNIYNQWASFVEFLLKEHGRESFDALYRSSSSREAGSADYRGVYGKTLSQLDAEWQAWLSQQP
jgi:hypothetical protein